MAWNPAPSDPRKDWMEYQFALVLLDSGMLGGPEINLVYRLKTDTGWSSVGASDGNIYMDVDFLVADFQSWWQSIQAEINKRLKAKCEFLGSAPPLQISSTIGTTPLTWAEFKVWLRDNLIWSVATQQPTGVFPLYINRAFAGGYGFDVGINADGSPACRVNTPLGWKVAVFQ